MWRFLSIITFNNFAYALWQCLLYFVLTALLLLCFLAGLMSVMPVCQNTKNSPDTGIVITHFINVYVCEELYMYILPLNQ